MSNFTPESPLLSQTSAIFMAGHLQSNPYVYANICDGVVINYSPSSELRPNCFAFGQTRTHFLKSFDFQLSRFFNTETLYYTDRVVHKKVKKSSGFLKSCKM